MASTGKLNPNFSKTGKNRAAMSDEDQQATSIQHCVQNELERYFDLLDGEEPSHLYRMVIRQVENALLESVMRECRGNQTRAALWLGISRGNLRNKLSNMEKK
jgi:Fis family transcriptional regulator